MGMTIIKNFGMPHNCYDCDLHNYHECDLTGESIEEDYCWNGDSREKHCPLVEAIPKADYETRLKADMVDMLKEISKEMDELNLKDIWEMNVKDCCKGIVQANIKELEGDKNGKEN